MAEKPNKRVCVIGAGASGLTTVKQLLDEGQTPVCFEMEEHVGGIFYWAQHKNGVYDNTVLTISNGLMSFSDFSPKERYFWGHSEYFQYLQDYAKYFNLDEHIQFNTMIESVEQVGDMWEVVTRPTVLGKPDKSKGATKHIFDAVAVCTGTHQIPRLPKIKGLDSFPAEDIVHTSQYKNAQPFKDKTVVCVGLGESGADITREIACVGDCTVALRTLPCVLPRLTDSKASTDMFSTRLHHEIVNICAHQVWGLDSYDEAPKSHIFDLSFFPALVMAAIQFVMIVIHFVYTVLISMPYARLVKGSFGNDHFRQSTHDKDSLDLNTKWTPEMWRCIFAWNRHVGGNFWGQVLLFSRKFLTKNATFLPYVLDGRLKLNASGVKHVEGREVHFNDGSVITADKIVLCTGYKDQFKFLKGIEVPEDNVRNLYRHAFHPDVGPSLAFIGWVRPCSGGIPICSEMVARYFAAVQSGRCTLPANLPAEIKRHQVFEETSLANSCELKSTIPSQPLFMDPIAKDLGCEVKPFDYLFDPVLLYKLWNGGFLAQQYRLRGPHNCYKEARAYIMSQHTAWVSAYDLKFLLSGPIMAADMLLQSAAGRLFIFPALGNLLKNVKFSDDEKYRYGFPKEKSMSSLYREGTQIMNDPSISIYD